MKLSVSTRPHGGRATRSRAWMCAIVSLAVCLGAYVRPVHADSKPVVASVVAIDGKLVLDRPGAGKYAAFVQMPDFVGDTLTTEAKSVAAIEFVVGGKIGINPGSSVVISGARSATDSSGQVLRVNNGAVWAKFDKQKSPLLIRTPSATIGIRGTEFLINADNDSTTIDVFDGKVAYAPTKAGDEVAALPDTAPVATPGMRIIIGNALKAKVESYDPEKLRKEDAEKHKDLASALVALRIVSNIAGFIPGGSNLYPAIGYAATAIEFVNDPQKAALDLAASQVESRVPMGGMLGGMIRSANNSGQKKDPDFPIDLKPYNQDGADPVDLRFTWKQFKDAKQYVVLVSKNESMDQANLQWAATVKDPNAAYPKDGPPMQAGQKYFWRVVAMNEEGKAMGKASQTWFTVSGSYKAPGQ